MQEPAPCSLCSLPGPYLQSSGSSGQQPCAPGLPVCRMKLQPVPQDGSGAGTGCTKCSCRQGRAWDGCEQRAGGTSGESGNQGKQPVGWEVEELQN